MNGISTFTRIGSITSTLVEESIAAGLAHLTEDEIEDLLNASLLETYERELAPRSIHERAMLLSGL